MTNSQKQMGLVLAINNRLHDLKRKQSGCISMVTTVVPKMTLITHVVSSFRFKRHTV